MKNIDWYSIKRWILLIMILSITIIMCSRCSSEFHLKRAIKKNPELSLNDTIVDVQIRPVEPFNFDFDISTLETKNIVLESVRERDTVKIYLEREGDLAKLMVDCPDCIDSIIYVPKVRFIQEELSQRALYKEAKERLSDWNKIRLMKGELISVFILGIITFILIKTLIKRVL